MRPRKEVPRFGNGIARAAILFPFILILALGSSRAAGLLPALPDWQQLTGGSSPAGEDMQRLRRLNAEDLSANLDSLHASAGLDLLLRISGPDSLQDYRARVGRLTGLHRRGSLWAGWRAYNGAAEISQRGLYDDPGQNDAVDLDQERRGGDLTLGLIRDDLSLALRAGRGHDWNLGFTLLSRRGGAEFGLALGIDTGAWESTTSFSGREYRFSLPFRREYALASMSDQALSLPRLEFYREVLAPTAEPRGDFNEPWAERQGFRLGWLAPRLPLRTDLELEKGRARASMFADEIRFIDLTSVRFHSLRMQGRVFPDARTRLLFGVEDVRLQAKDSDFDPTPFSFWLIFVNTRYSLDSFDYRLLRWHLGIERQLGSATGRYQLTTALRHEWLLGGGRVHWAERVPLLPPFYFTWEQHRSDLPLPGRAALRLDLNGSVRLGRTLRLEWEAAQMVLLTADGGSGGGGQGSPGTDGGNEDGVSTYGGFRGRLGLSYRRP